MGIPALIPVDQSAVHPAITLEDLIDALLADLPKQFAVIKRIGVKPVSSDGLETVAVEGGPRKTWDRSWIEAAMDATFDASFEGKIRAYVRDEDTGNYLRIRAHYWAHFLAREYQEGMTILDPSCDEQGDYASGVIGQIIVYAAKEIAPWIESTRGSLTAEWMPAGVARPTKRPSRPTPRSRAFDSWWKWHCGQGVELAGEALLRNYRAYCAKQGKPCYSSDSQFYQKWAEVR